MDGQILNPLEGDKLVSALHLNLIPEDTASAMARDTSGAHAALKLEGAEKFAYAGGNCIS